MILANKIKNVTLDEIKFNPQLKYNLYFIELSNKLKNVYFQNLNTLITILDKLKSDMLINNKTLNIISDEVKTIIDNMYSLCHYYYIYAIISLINLDITEKNNSDIILEKYISKALNK